MSYKIPQHYDFLAINTNADDKNKKCHLSLHCFLHSVSLLQLIIDATRITPISSSINDIFFVYEPDIIKQSLVLPVAIKK